MKLLLDTHVWLWCLLEPQKIGRRAKRALDRDADQTWLSPISTWEVITLAEKGRIDIGDDPWSWVARALKAVPLREAVLTHEIARESRRFSLSHEDPADRFLVASCRVLDLVLVTADARLLEAGACQLLPCV